MRSSGTTRSCSWCSGPIPERARKDSVFCKRLCRQAAHRLRERREAGQLVAFPGETPRPGRFCYADPPYPRTSKRYYGGEETYAGEVDHEELLGALMQGGYDGWALSTSARALKDVLALSPRETRVCAWVKPLEPSPQTNGLHNTWEPLLVYGGRQEPPGRRDWLLAAPARYGGDLPGRKPLAFCAWLFDCLGMQPGDELVDLFPGTGVVSRAWAEIGRGGPPRRVAEDVGHVSSPPAATTRRVARSQGDASPLEPATGGLPW